MKKIIIGLLLCLTAAGSFAQIKISALTTATGKAKSGWVPVVQGGVTKKIRTDSIAAQANHYSDSIVSLAYDSLKNYTDSVAGEISVGAGEVITTKVSVSSAEILNGYVATKTLIAAPGAGKVIRPISLIAKYNYGTAQYAGNQMAVTLLGNTIFSPTAYLSSSNAFEFRTPSSFGVTVDLSNQPLLLYVTGANPTTGDGTVDFYITYTVITL